MAELLEHTVAVREVSSSSPGRGGHKTFANVGNLLTTSISAWLSNDSDSIHLIHTMQSQEQHNNTPYKTPYTLELDLGPFPPDVARSFPTE